MSSNLFSNRKVSVIATLVALLFCVYLALTFVCSPYGNKISLLSIGDEILLVENVISNQKLAKGLGGRKRLCQNCGMLFNFSRPAEHAFWMKDMLIPLDILWIRDDVIVQLEKNVPANFAGVMKPSVLADSVLELNAGKVDAWDIKMGDRLERH